MRESKSDEERSAVETATCLAEMSGALQLVELANWFQNLFGRSPAGPLWDRFKITYVLSVLENQHAKAMEPAGKPAPSVVRTSSS